MSFTHSIFNFVSNSLGYGVYSQPAHGLAVTKEIPKDFKMSAFKCTGDDDCMNMDSYRSKPGQAPVFSCPAAKCAGGDCICGSDCKLDPYLGVCCQDIEVIGNDVFCVEDRTAILKIKDDDLAHDQILDSNGNPWDYISSPNSAFKKQMSIANFGASKGLQALQNLPADKKQNIRMALAQKKQDHVNAKSSGSNQVCNVPDQLIYNKDKTQYIVVPGSAVCNIYKKYSS